MPKLANRQVFCCSGYILARFCPGEAINSPESVREDHQKAQNSTTVTRIVALARKNLTENQRSDQKIFLFLEWLRVGEAEQVELRDAVQGAQEFP